MPGPWSKVVELRPGLVLVESGSDLTSVEEALRRHVPPGTPLFVAELRDARRRGADPAGGGAGG